MRFILSADLEVLVSLVPPAMIDGGGGGGGDGSHYSAGLLYGTSLEAFHT